MPAPFNDNFNRPSGDLNGSTSSDGQFTWGSFISGSWVISNDAQAGCLNDDGIITASFGVADSILIESQLESNASDQGICFRCEGTTDHNRLALNAGTGYLQAKNGGAYSTVDSFSHTFAVGDWMGIRLDGTNVYVTKNGVDVHGPVSMTLNPSATHHGLAGAVGGVGITTSAAFRITSTGGGGGSAQPPRTMHQFRQRRAA